MIKTVVFDIGNVLGEFRWKDLLRDMGYDEEMVQRIGEATVYTRLWRELDRSDDIQDNLIHRFVQADPEIGDDIRRFLEHSAQSVREYDYATDWIDRLKNKGYRVYLLSNYGGRNYRYAKENFNFISHVDGGVISYEVGFVKPEPEIYEALIRKYDIIPEETVFFDDMLINVEAANAFGFHGIQFIDMDQALKELAKYQVTI